MTAHVYQPGVCNIGPAEIRQRRAIGVLGLAVTVVALALFLAFDVPWPWRLLVALPAIGGATGFLQGALHFCVRFGMSGLFNFDDLGKQEAVHETEYRRRDRAKAVAIVAGSVVIGLVVAVIAAVLP
jgi:hypothetical protein